MTDGSLRGWGKRFAVAALGVAHGSRAADDVPHRASPATDERLQRWRTHLAVAALCVLLALSVATRVLTLSDATTESGPADGARAVDLGEGVVLSGASTAPRDVLVGACWTSIPVEFVEPSPRGNDASSVKQENAADRVFYAYHGWVFGGRFATVELIIRHLIWRGVSILRLDGVGGRDSLAVKLTMPAGCGADPEVAMAALRRDVRAGP